MKKEETKEVRHQRTLLIPVLRKQRQKDLCEFKASWVYIASSRTARATHRNLVSKKKTTNNWRKERKKKNQVKQWIIVSAW